MSNKARWVRWGIGVTVLLIGVVSATAEKSDEFSNLKVLPKDIGKQQLGDIMGDFSSALGVGCDHCHAKKTDASGGLDFASDELEDKKVARTMMNMTREINQELLPGIGRPSLVRVTCLTCHRGLAKPESLKDLLLATATEKDIDSAIARYRELRETYYGSGSYDFGPATLDGVAQTLAQTHKDIDGAISMVGLGLEFYPDNAHGHLLLGQLYAAKGDKNAAVTSIERALELDPGNDWAKRVLEQVRASE